jgi:hypothetical protein
VSASVLLLMLMLILILKTVLGNCGPSRAGPRTGAFEFEFGSEP